MHSLERPPHDPQLVLIAPYRSKVADQLAQAWINRYSGKRYAITTEPSNARHRPGIVTVKTYRDMLAEYSVHLEAKSNGLDASPCNRRTVGLLARRPVTARAISHIGKEASRLEEAQAGLIQATREILGTYDDADQSALEQWALPILRKLGVREVGRRTGLSLGAVQAVLARHVRPRRAALRNYLDIAAAAEAESRRGSLPAIPSPSNPTLYS